LLFWTWLISLKMMISSSHHLRLETRGRDFLCRLEYGKGTWWNASLAQRSDKQGVENLKTTQGILECAANRPNWQDQSEMDKKAHLACNFSKPMVLGHGGLAILQGRRFFIKPLSKGATRGSVFLMPTHTGILSLF
jgi:hypothetical protein